MGPRAERAREETNLPEPETIPVAKKETTEGNYGAAAGLAGTESMSDTSPASTSVVASANPIARQESPSWYAPSALALRLL